MRLLAEDLHIRIEEDSHYQVEARYTLANPSGPRKVLFGVPIAPEEDPEPPDEEPPDAGPRASDATVCQSVVVELPGQPPVTTWTLATDEDELRCVAELSLPQGDSIALVMRYRGQLAFVDYEYSKSALTTFEPRTLKYDLSPAGYWAGPPHTVSISIDGGAWGPYMRIQSPKGKRVVNGVASWQLTDVDLAKAKPIKVTFDVRSVLEQKQMLQLGKADSAKLEAKASSTLGTKYPAANLTDADPATAWCASKADKHPWFEIRKPERKGDRGAPGGFDSFFIIPGYAKSERAWRLNARVTEVRVTDCANPKKAFDINVASTARFDGSAVALDTGSVTDDTLSPVLGEAFDNGPGCIRVTLLAWTPGAGVCVSEFGFFRNSQ